MTASNAPSERLRIGLLQCGHIVPTVAEGGRDYVDLFGALLGPHRVELTVTHVDHGDQPHDTDVDGWLISGSPASVYDDLPWIAPTEDLVRRVVDAGQPVVGICFGHQLLAQALGGRVERAGVGWGAGIYTYDLADGWYADGSRPADDKDGADTVSLIASHQDQVVEMPDGARLAARTDHCPIAAFTIGTQVLSIQPHPEFTTGLSRELSTQRRERMGADTTDAAIGSLSGPGAEQVAADAARVAERMVATWRI